MAFSMEKRLKTETPPPHGSFNLASFLQSDLGLKLGADGRTINPSDGGKIKNDLTCKQAQVLESTDVLYAVVPSVSPTRPPVFFHDAVMRRLSQRLHR